MTAALTRQAVEDFLYAEAALLDAWKLDEWFKLLTDDASYFVPPNDKPDADHRFTLFTIADDIVRLRERVIRLKDPNCHAEYPPSRTRRLITNVRLLTAEGDEARATANFAVWRFQHEQADVHVGRYLHLLVRGPIGLMFRERRAVLDLETLRPHGKLSFIL